MENQSENKGFILPAPAPPKEQPTTPTISPPTSGLVNIVPHVGVANDGPQPRDYVVGGGILLVLLIAFFFAKRAYANHLALKRVSAGASNSAGWWLFIFLAGLATAAVLAVLSPIKFMTPIFMVPLLVISVVALILMFVTGRRA